MNEAFSHSSESLPKPIKVLIIAPAFPLVGGQTVQAARLMNAFSKESGLIVGFQPINPEFLPRLQRIKYIRTLVTSLKYVFDLFRVVRNYDVVHIFSASYFSFVLVPLPALMAARLCKKRSILNYRSGEARDHLITWRRTALPAIKRFDKVVTPSAYLVDVFAEFGIKANSISNFVDLDKFRFRDRNPLRPVFLSNRNFEPLYNVSCVLRAFRLIQDTFPEASLIVVGEGPERGRLQDLSHELRLCDVEFIGSVRPEEMPAYYDRADVYLNSPSIDNMPNSVIEAFACGLPVASTNAGGIPYIIEDGKTGLLVEINDHKALARAALVLINDGNLAAEIIKNARLEVQKYSWPAVRQEWLRLYEELASRSLEKSCEN